MAEPEDQESMYIPVGDPVYSVNPFDTPALSEIPDIFEDGFDYSEPEGTGLEATDLNNVQTFDENGDLSPIPGDTVEEQIEYMFREVEPLTDEQLAEIFEDEHQPIEPDPPKQYNLVASVQFHKGVFLLTLPDPSRDEPDRPHHLDLVAKAMQQRFFDYSKENGYMFTDYTSEHNGLVYFRIAYYMQSKMTLWVCSDHKDEHEEEIFRLFVLFVAVSISLSSRVSSVIRNFLFRLYEYNLKKEVQAIFKESFPDIELNII